MPDKPDVKRFVKQLDECGRYLEELRELVASGQSLGHALADMPLDRTSQLLASCAMEIAMRAGGVQITADYQQQPRNRR